MDLKAAIREIPDFPKPGISFKDITTLLRDPQAFRQAVRELADRFRDSGAQTVVAVESRGFILGAAVAYELGLGFVPLRKPGKLPAQTRAVTYELEYGEDSLEVHADSFAPGTKVLIIDDLVATGGTTEATVRLVEELGAEVAGIGFLVELAYLPWREKLKGYRVEALVSYASE